MSKEDALYLIGFVLAIFFVYVYFFVMSPCDRLTRDVTPSQLQECLEKQPAKEVPESEKQ